MISRSEGDFDWQSSYRQAITDVGVLLDHLELTSDQVELPDEHLDFPLRVPRSFVARMQPRDPRDPLLLQVLATRAEESRHPDYVDDPLAEEQAIKAPGLLHKYRGRALLVATGACAVHCRYCFRRHFPYGEQSATQRVRRQALAALEGDPSIREIILSGGDPLSLSNRAFGELVAELAAIPHLRRLRIHSRLPIVLPERVDAGLLEILGGPRFQTVMVVHANHPREIDDQVGDVLQRLVAGGTTVLNQAVLLAGVNDRVDTLCELSESLFANRVLPYYLNLLDPVAGAAHFDVPEGRAQELLAATAARLPGYLVPRLVREEPGAAAKVPVDLRSAYRAEPSQ
ncbi:MAG: EF-P beta-lysylation protein EpmB [Acidobacteriota bacterium]